MKTKQDQIDKMLLDVPQTIVAYDANPKGQHLYGEQRRQIAVALYDVGYRKVPDGAVVLTPEERDEEMKATNEILAERDDLKEKVESLKSEKEGWKMRYSDSGQKNKKLSIKNTQLKAENKQLKTECALLDDELRVARQDTINVLNELKNKCHNYYPSIDHYCCSVKAVNLSDIDEMIEELIKNGEDKS